LSNRVLITVTDSTAVPKNEPPGFVINASHINTFQNYFTDTLISELSIK